MISLLITICGNGNTKWRLEGEENAKEGIQNVCAAKAREYRNHKRAGTETLCTKAGKFVY